MNIPSLNELFAILDSNRGADSYVVLQKELANRIRDEYRAARLDELHPTPEPKSGDIVSLIGHCRLAKLMVKSEDGKDSWLAMVSDGSVYPVPGDAFRPVGRAMVDVWNANETTTARMVWSKLVRDGNWR